MAERKATNKYYPPEWNPKDGSINKFVGQHPLRDRARKLDQGILIVRFEMPYNVYCDTCKNHIAKGRRYNAEKKSIGKYFTTTIWSFSMKCHHCSARIEVQTDPQNRDYALSKGIHRVLAEETKNDTVTSTYSMTGDEKQDEMRNDPFKRLEHLQEDKEFADEEKVHLIDLLEFRDRLASADYQNNSALRKSFRVILGLLLQNFCKD
uniref:Splicing factor YJU2 n=1 Tax=Arcella intermedia TaxID=1963864 RepID=A0A6B2LJ55_9EUKA|eukprot:TRINITY_DN1948_c0_g1_i1.p1 TRINITY_DN1948_c0_g1~~TRINITY_DN1948_c0_g1_i1.p1  ORF type:complete len:207 (-),score=42.76 TRINITY_DN1948_c0_g1_i1:420-1040(-)